MSQYDFSAQRLFVAEDLAPGTVVALAAEHINYLLNVLRLRDGNAVIVFNGRDGEFGAQLCDVTRRAARLHVGERLRPQTPRANLEYCFAPLKQARQDYMAQKAVEMGVGRLTPVITNRTQARRVNTDRLRANAIEAAEQCGVLSIPDISEPIGLSGFLAINPATRLLVYCDEDAPIAAPIAALATCEAPNGISVLVGPEGGFDEVERKAILAAPNLLRLSLGPRILRADTAAVGVLALVQATLGDWRGN